MVVSVAEESVQQAEAYFAQHQIRALVSTLLVQLAKAKPEDPISFMQNLLSEQTAIKENAMKENLVSPNIQTPNASDCATQKHSDEPTVEAVQEEHDRALATYEKLGQLKKAIAALGKPVEAVSRLRRQSSQVDADKVASFEDRLQQEERSRDEAFDAAESLASNVDEAAMPESTCASVEEVLRQGRLTLQDKGSLNDYNRLLQRCTQSIFADQKRLLQRIKELKKRLPKSPAAAPGKPPRAPVRMSPEEQLQQRWFELELLLRSPVASAEDWQRLGAATKDAQHFLGDLERLAKELGVLKGVLSRHLLPFDSNTDIHDQSNRRPLSPRSAAIMQENGLGALSQMEGGALEKRLIDQAISLRQLVRVKLADDADIAQAQSAIDQLASFCSDLQSAADSQGKDAYELLAALVK